MDGILAQLISLRSAMVRGGSSLKGLIEYLFEGGPE